MTTVGGCHNCKEAGVVQRVASKVMGAWGVKDRNYSWWKLKPRFASFIESLGNTCTIKRDEAVTSFGGSYTQCSECLMVALML